MDCNRLIINEAKTVGNNYLYWTMNIDDLIDELRQRLRSPLFASFLISWLLINWRIPIALIFYKKEDLASDGYKTYNDFIAANYHIVPSVVLPIVMALAYCFILKPLMILSVTAIETSTNKRSYKIAEKGTVPMQKFLSTKLKYEKLVKDIENSDNNENTLKAQINDLAEKNLDFRVINQQSEAKINELQNEVKNLNSKILTHLDTSVLNGDWTVKIGLEEFVWQIDNGSLSDNINGTYNFLYFFHNPDTNNIKFSIRDADAALPINPKYYDLTYKTSASVLKGTQNSYDNVYMVQKLRTIS